MLAKNRGVGMLLASIGSRAPNETKGKDGNSSAEVNIQKTTKRNYQDDGASGSRYVSSWASMKQYDDDHDKQWFKDQNAELAELYGGDFIYTKYLDSQPGKIGYYCEICFAEMTAKSSLELHCLGMKHLKKKAMWEKMKGKDGNSSAEVNIQKTTKRNYQDDGASGSRYVSSWASMKQYDDDHDRQWFEDQNAELAELYGGDFIYTKYLDSQPGKIGYYCELCFAENNARSSLELHCLGMKHLKKKAMWEKMKVRDEDGIKPERGPPKPPHKVARQGPSSHPPRHQPSPHGRHNRGPSPVEPSPRMRGSSYREPPPPEFRNNNDHYGRRDGYDRDPDNYYNDYYRKEPMPYRPPYDEVSEFPYERRSPHGPRDFRHSPGPDRRDIRDQYSRERYSPYNPREAPPPPVISGPDRLGPGNHSQFDTSPALFAGISDGSCSEILKRLAVCRVKNVEDTALATNVATFLLSSLTEYYSRTGPSSVVQVLEEMNAKMNIMKDLLKLTSRR
ncbi:uncharacterized protein LOC127007443 isoform X2 [Eriocheir sinensis]|nr:uncharacterized protein LOC127007443 isoform X2 [Eriocheir sinensis]XP_050734440.1 uncharacterized protein LOC127007443 isoform X2 [Eriocheir sinensis]